MSVRLLKSCKWNPPPGTHCCGSCPCTEGTETTDKSPTDILSMSTMEPPLWGDAGGGSGVGFGAPPAGTTWACAGTMGLSTTGMVGARTWAVPACAHGVAPHIANRA